MNCSCYTIGTLCRCKSWNTTQQIYFEFLRIVSHYIKLTILCCYFDSTNFTGVTGLFLICTCYTLGTISGCNSLGITGVLINKPWVSQIFVPCHYVEVNIEISVPVHLSGCISLETPWWILLMFCWIVSHHFLLISLCSHFDSKIFTGVMGLSHF